MTSKKYPLLLSEGKIGRLTIRNRMIMPAMETNFALKTGKVNERVIRYYQRRAKGGVGLIIVEGSYFSKEGRGFLNQIGIHDDDMIPGLRELVKAVQETGAKIAVQLLHSGRQTRSEVTGCPVVSAWDIPCPLMKEKPVPLTKEHILLIIKQYAEAAKRARKAGFDAIEVHGAHGYLIHQFLSPLANKREDAYGGSKENRIRFALEVLAAIRAAVGNEYPIIFRISAKEFMEGGIDLPLSTYYCKQLSPHIDALHVSGGAYGATEWISQPYSNEPGLLAPFAAHIRQTVDIPVVTVGRIHSPELAEGILSRQEADFIAIGRGLIADPDLPLKIENDCCDDIWRCLSCNIGCVDRLSKGLDISCLINPWVGKESMDDVPIKPGTRCLICGGGPAGLSAAVTLAKKGAKVIIAEEKEIGGQFLLASKVLFKASFGRIIQLYAKQLKALGVEVIQATADLDLVKKINPNHVILATGSIPNAVAIPGIDTLKHMAYPEAIEDGVKEHSIIIVGGGAVGCELAELLAEKGKKVRIIEIDKDLARELGGMRKILLDRLHAMDIEVFTKTRIAKIQNKKVFIETEGIGEKILDDAECLIFACGVRPNNFLEDELKTAGIDYVCIGDCLKPRNAFWAIREGFERAMSL